METISACPISVPFPKFLPKIQKIYVKALPIFVTLSTLKKMSPR